MASVTFSLLECKCVKILKYLLGAPPYDGRICLQENNGIDTTNSQGLKGDEELSRVYQTLTMPVLAREEANNTSNR